MTGLATQRLIEAAREWKRRRDLAFTVHSCANIDGSCHRCERYYEAQQELIAAVNDFQRNETTP